MVLYVVHPAEMMNVRFSVYEASLASFKSTATTHFLEKEAANVGFCQARDNEGNNMNRTVMFIECPLGDLLPKDFAALSLEGTKYIDMRCTVPAKIKFNKCVTFGLRNCCFKVKCAKGVGPRGAISCDAGNYYMDSTGAMKQSRIFAQITGRGPKRPLDDTQAAASEKSAIGIATSLELHSCTQVCRAFFRGRCLKDNDTTRPIGDPMRYSETHDKPKGEVKCCSILSMDDALFHTSPSPSAATR